MTTQVFCFRFFKCSIKQSNNYDIILENNVNNYDIISEDEKKASWV